MSILKPITWYWWVWDIHQPCKEEQGGEVSPIQPHWIQSEEEVIPQSTSEAVKVGWMPGGSDHRYLLGKCQVQERSNSCQEQYEKRKTTSRFPGREEVKMSLEG